MAEAEAEADSQTKAKLTEPDLRTLYVLVYSSPLFAAHWSFWLPYLDAIDRESHIGDRVHATGDRLNGFEYEYLQNYDAKEDSRRPEAFPIGRVPSTCLSSPDKQTKSTAPGDADVLNLLDQTLRQVPVPGPSLNKVVAGAAVGPPPRKAEVKDCQWWIKQAVTHLVEKGILLPWEEGNSQTETPSVRVEKLPKH